MASKKAKSRTAATEDSKKARRRRVWLLGAGVSASCGIAVAKDILKEAIVKLRGEDAARYESITKLLSYLYPRFDDELGNYPNIEDFLNLLEVAKTFNSENFIDSSVWPTKELERAKNFTLDALTAYLWHRVQDSHSLDVLRRFAVAHLKPGDTIITFNWDVTIERALYARPGDMNIYYTYKRDRSQKSNFVILKPHGSIDWFRKKDMPPRALSESDELDETWGVYPRFDFAKDPKLRKSRPLMVPPIAAKEFSVPCLQRTWRSFYRAVSDATELNVLGYSLPKEDQFARLVLRRALRSNSLKVDRHKKKPLAIRVVNPDENVGFTFTRLADSKRGVEFFQARFEDYVRWMDGSDEG
jgi:hypothetical protein